MTLPAPTSAIAAKLPAPDLTTLLECAWRHKWLSLVAGSLVAVLCAAGGWFGVPARYKAIAMVRLGGPQGLIEKPNESSNAQREFRSTQQELIRMPHVLRRALESPKVAALDELHDNPDAFDLVSSRLELELPRGSEILRIGVQHDRAEIAFVLANAVTEAYLEEVHRADQEDIEKRTGTLDKLHATTEERLGKTWSELQSLARQLGSGDPAALSLQAQAEIENYRSYARRLRDLRTEKRESERLVKSIQDSPEMLSKEVSENTSQNSVRYAMFTAKLKREQALARWGPDHPEVKAATREENLLSEYYQKSAAEDKPEPRSRKEELLSEPLAAIARLSHEEQALESMIKEIEDRLQILGGDNTSKLEILRNEISRMEKLSDRLWQTREHLEVERHADNRVQLVSYASLPGRRDLSKRNKLTLILAAAGFGLTLFLIVAFELLTGRLHSLRDAGKRTGLEMLGALPPLPGKLVNTGTSDLHPQAADPQALTPPAPHAAPDAPAKLRAELDMLVARLLHHPTLGKPQTILVASAASNHERANFAAHLAQTLARAGKKTIVVDLDLRDCVPQRVFHQPSSGGLTELLHRNVNAHDLQLQNGIPNLKFLPVGRYPQEPLTVLTHSRLEDLLKQLKQDFEFVILDTAPVTEFPDAVHVGRLADVALLSIRKNISCSARVVQARERLERIGLPVMGALIQ